MPSTKQPGHKRVKNTARKINKDIDYYVDGNGNFQGRLQSAYGDNREIGDMQLEEDKRKKFSGK